LWPRDVIRTRDVSEEKKRVSFVRAVIASRGWAVALVAAALSLGACEMIRHDRGGDSCYCYTDMNGSAATVGHRWKL
jgi:hypothetical protein